VRAELAQLGADELQPEVAVSGNRMHVVLRDGAGLVLGERDVEAAADCHERATQVAVLAATWMGIWSAGSTPSPPVVSAPVPSPTSRLEISLTALAAHDGHAGALGGHLMAQTVLSSGGAWRGLFALSGLTERDATVGPGSAGYFHVAADVGTTLRGQRRGVFVEGALAGRLALLRVQGKGLAVTHSAFLVVPGVSSFVRAGLAGRKLSVFVMVGGSARLNRYELVLDDAQARAELPRAEALLGLGIGWAFGG
jgi:hypothetical protein